MARVAGESPNMSDSSEDRATVTARRTVDTLPRRRYGRDSGSRPPRDKNRSRRERRKVFKISVNKINRIDDINICMRRFVLIKNTGNRLQAEIRNDRIAARIASDALSSSAGQSQSRRSGKYNGTQPVDTIDSREYISKAPANCNRTDSVGATKLNRRPRKKSSSSAIRVFPARNGVKRKRSSGGKQPDGTGQRDAEDADGKKQRTDGSSAADTSCSTSVSTCPDSAGLSSPLNSRWRDVPYDDRVSVDADPSRDVPADDCPQSAVVPPMSLQEEHYNRVAAIVRSASPTIQSAERVNTSAAEIELALFRDMIAWLES